MGEAGGVGRVEGWLVVRQLVAELGSERERSRLWRRLLLLLLVLLLLQDSRMLLLLLLLLLLPWEPQDGFMTRGPGGMSKAVWVGGGGVGGGDTHVDC